MPQAHYWGLNEDQEGLGWSCYQLVTDGGADPSVRPRRATGPRRHRPLYLSDPIPGRTGVWEGGVIGAAAAGMDSMSTWGAEFKEGVVVVAGVWEG